MPEPASRHRNSSGCDVAGHPSCMSRGFPHGSGASGAVVEGLVDAVGVEGEFAGEAAVDEDVACGAGHDRERTLVVVAGSDGDPPFLAEAEAAAIHDSGVDATRDAQRPVGGAGLGGCVPHVGGSLAAEASVGPVMVVDEAEQIELCLELFERRRPRLLREPALLSLGYPLYFA